MELSRGIRAFVAKVFGVRAPARAQGPGGAFTLYDAEGRPVMGYDAGRVSRFDADFTPPGVGPNRLAEMRLARVWRNMRHLVENNPLLCGARDTWRRNTIGKGMWLRPATGMPSLDKKLQPYFWRAMLRVDVGREIDLFESQRRFMDHVFAAGEILVYCPFTPAFRGAMAGPAIELLDSSDLMPLAMSGKNSGNIVRQGVEFDAIGRRVAYHVLRESPTDGGLFAGAAAAVPGTDGVRRIPAEDARLAFRAKWLGQIRGVPWAVATVTTTRMEEAMVEAELMLARARACVPLIVKGANPEQFGARRDVGGLFDADGHLITELAPGLIAYLPQPLEISQAFAQTAPGAALGATVELLHRLRAAGLGLGYATFTGDRSKSTFSADRAARLEERAAFEEVQLGLVWAQHTRPWWERVVRHALLRGDLDLTAEERAYAESHPDLVVEATPIAKGMAYVNPKDEATADRIALESGFKALHEVCGGRGESFDDVIDQQIEAEVYWREARREAGLPDADPPWWKPRGSTPAGAAGGERGGHESDEGDEGDGGDGEDDRAAGGRMGPVLNGHGHGGRR